MISNNKQKYKNIKKKKKYGNNSAIRHFLLIHKLYSASRMFLPIVIFLFNYYIAQAFIIL